MSCRWLPGLLLLVACSSSPPPAPRPERFGDGVFSTDAWDFFVAFSPDQRRALLGRADDAFEQFEMLETRRGADGRWSPPVRARFATAWSNADPHIAPDGGAVYFISNRPEPGETAARAGHDIFVATLGADGAWSDARRLPAPVNDPASDEWSPAVAASGNLYFGGERAGTRGGSDLWVARRLTGGSYARPENLGDAINTDALEVEPWIAPDESYLIFSALRRPGGRGGYDLYVSRRIDGRWQPATPLPASVNTSVSEWNHSVSPDGAWLYFTRSSRTLKGDMYRVPMAAIGL
jgi:hypothetical protein